MLLACWFLFALRRLLGFVSMAGRVVESMFALAYCTRSGGEPRLGADGLHDDGGFAENL